MVYLALTLAQMGGALIAFYLLWVTGLGAQALAAIAGTAAATVLSVRLFGHGQQRGAD